MVHDMLGSFVKSAKKKIKALGDIKITVLSGGVGGARLAHGFYQLTTKHNRSFSSNSQSIDSANYSGSVSMRLIVNTGDDFDYQGLYICPDLDTNMYTLAEINDEKQGWGIKNDTYNCSKFSAKLHLDNWFSLGDKDLAVHLKRTSLAKELTLSEITNILCKSLGITIPVCPMSDDRCPTSILTWNGYIPFQDYFVKNCHKDRVLGVKYDKGKPSPKVLDYIADADLIVIAPSNPYLSVLPILETEGISQALSTTSAYILAVSPIIGGKAVKGPLAQIMESLNQPVSSLGIAQFYQGMINELVIDTQDKDLIPAIENLGMRCSLQDTFMQGKEGRENLARAIFNKWLNELLSQRTKDNSEVNYY